MILIDTDFLFLSLFFALVVCYMLLVFARRRASPWLPLFRFTSQQRYLSPSPTALAADSSLRKLYSQSWSSTTMLRQAVKQHQSKAPAAPKSSAHQQPIDSLIPSASGARPFATSSGNISKYQNTPGAFPSSRSSSPTHGIKRSASGLAKVLRDEDSFEFSPLSGSENVQTSNAYKPTSNTTVSQATVYFDEDDFDSDLDLDVEDPASIGTVLYPTLPNIDAMDPPESKRSQSTSFTKPTLPSASTLDSFLYHAPEKAGSSSAVMTKESVASSSVVRGSTKRSLNDLSDTKEDQPKASRRKLPWATQQEKELSASAQAVLTKSAKDSVTSSENPSKSPYPWNTTATKLKEQQKTLRAANKKVKTNEATEEEKELAIKKKKSNTLHRIFLSEEQQHVLNLVVEQKKSVFFTGSAGTGKSVLLREIISSLRKKYFREPDRIAVTASTGLAACNIGGVTLHSFAGIGLGKESVEDLIKKIKKNQKAKQRWLRTKVLVIDEVSMVDGDLFDKLEEIARTIRKKGQPFGGIQLVITGDFFQLPPVPDSGRISRFAFDAATWNTAVEHTIGLHHIFRQRDPVFANMLNEMREGRLSAASAAAFKRLDRPLPQLSTLTDQELRDMEATELFPTRFEVDRANANRMQQLHGEVYDFFARDGGTIQDKTFRDKLLQNCMAPEKVSLKKGAQVMLIKNLDESLVNGSLGKVRAFMTERMFAEYQEHEEDFIGEGKDMPKENPQAILKAELMGLNPDKVYPVVRFALADGTTRDLHCKPETWKIELPNGEVQAYREQIPLILAWALSIHKAQGQTLERVRVDLGKVFEKGQAYVALSRATTMDGLQVLRFDAKKVIAHDKVRAFYNSLERAEQAGEKQKAKRQKPLDAFAYEEKFVGADEEEEERNRWLKAADGSM